MPFLRTQAQRAHVPVSALVAMAVLHEQEHCIRAPDDREKPAVDEQRRLALKVGNARLLENVTRLYGDLDRSGHWKS